MTPVEFAHDLTITSLPDEVRTQLKRCLLDLTGVAVAGTTTELSGIIRDHAARHFGSAERAASLLVDGRTVSPVGAALAGGMTIDSIDAHDGHRLTKGHAGCGALPAALALAQAHDLDDGAELLTLLALGYELGTRAGMTLHATVSDYHTSGAWIAVAVAAMGARVLGLDQEQTREAMGIAEYHGPRSQMMRAIDHPTMVKDGSGWGAMAGVSAAYLAADGFTGAPAITVESDDVAEVWSDLGSRWLIHDQYFKPYPVCRWAQPAVAAVQDLLDDHEVTHDQIEHVEIVTFHEASRLAAAAPSTTEEAQYSLAWPVAAAIVRGRVGVHEISGPSLADPEILRLSTTTRTAESDEFNIAFPARRFARVVLVLSDGSRLASEPTEAGGDPEHPLSDGELGRKYQSLTHEVIGADRAAALADEIEVIDQDRPLDSYIGLLVEPPPRPSELERSYSAGGRIR